MKMFMFQINYHHQRTGKLIETKFGIVKADTPSEAEKKIWDIYGTDNASMPNSIIDITDKETVSFSIYANNFSN